MKFRILLLLLMLPSHRNSYRNFVNYVSPDLLRKFLRVSLGDLGNFLNLLLCSAFLLSSSAWLMSVSWGLSWWIWIHCWPCLMTSLAFALWHCRLFPFCSGVGHVSCFGQWGLWDTWMSLFVLLLLCLCRCNIFRLVSWRIRDCVEQSQSIKAEVHSWGSLRILGCRLL